MVLDWILLNYFSAQLDGSEKIPPSGGALLVGNHALWGIDSAVLRALVERKVGRKIRFLGERNLWKVPGLHYVLDAVGAVEGSRANALKLLEAGELVCVYPGGIDDSWKVTPSQRHRLMWGERSGFAQVAAVARVSIFPIAGIGIDDVFTVLGREPWLGRRIFGSPKYDFPITHGWLGTPLPRRVPLKFMILEPIHTANLDSTDPTVIAELRNQVYERLGNFLQMSEEPLPS